MSGAKKAKAARPAKRAKKAKAAAKAKPAKRVKGAAGVTALLLAVLTAGCALTVNRTPIMSESAGETVVAYATALKSGFGNKEATTLGNYTLSADGGLSISNLSNQNDASLAFVRAIELGASLGAAYMGRPLGAVSGTVDVAPVSVAASDTGVTPGSRRPAINTVLDDRIAEAKASGKTLVVVAGHPLCGYCTRFEADLTASGIPGRSDIVLVRELNPWDSNAASLWTGGGNAPIVRVTRWDASGGLVSDRKLNRPSVADLAAALDACLAPTQ
jgi:hypothetical protein